MGTIYILKNKTNNKYYVGQTTKEFKIRFRQHQTSHSIVGCSLRKHTADNFDKLILEDIPEEELDYWERHYIQECNSLVPNGYNLETGGNKNKQSSKETREKISKANKGRHLTEETRKKMSEAHKGKSHIGGMLGKHHTEETKQKISKSHVGLNNWTKGENNPFFGKHHTEETKKIIKEKRALQIITEEHRRNISKGNMGRKFTEETKKKLSVAAKNRKFSSAVIKR